MKVPDAVIRAVLEHLAEQVAVCDPSGRVVRANEAWRRASGDSGRFVDGFQDPSAAQGWLEDCLSHPAMRFRTLCLHRGQWGWLSLTALVDEFLDTVGILAEIESSAPLESRLKGFGLSARELDVAYRLLQGHPTRTIAESLGLSEATIKTHTAHVLRKAGVRSRYELAALLS